MICQSMASDSRPQKPRTIKRIQTVAVLILSIAGVVNYLDRGSLSIANTTIRADLGFSGTRMGALLSVFSLAYAISQLPSGWLLDRLGARVVLSAGMLLWSLTQAATGMVNSFGSFVSARIGLAMGESPYVISAVKTVHDWFDIRERATPLGIVNASTTFGQAIAPPILTGIMLAFGWRGMFMLIGLPGMALSIVWFLFYRDRKNSVLTDAEKSYMETANAQEEKTRISLSQWLGLFRLRTVWGMMVGFGGINYTVWFYMSWMPGYLETERHVSIATTGLIATIPFLCGVFGMLASGVIADHLIRRGVPPVKSHKTLLVTGLTCSAMCSLLVVHAAGALGAAFAIGMALFFIYIAGNSGWGLVQSMAPGPIVGSVSSIQNFGSFVCASFAPLIAGWLLDRTHSFRLSLASCSMVALLGALSYLFVVKDPIQMQTAPEPR